MKVFFSVMLTIAVIVIFGLLYIYSGIYNVSAMEQDGKVTRWILNTTRQRSIESRLKDVTAPNLEDKTMIDKGLSHYKEMCEDCHGAPGKQASELSKGLNPPAPDLVRWGSRISPEEIFWVTKNGIRMTGMPAWGKTHSDKKIWAIVAAVRKLDQISKEKYNSISEEDEEGN